MQRHKSAEKEARKNKKANVVNRESRSRVKTAVRDVLDAKDKASGAVALQKAYSVLDKSVKTKLIHPNNAANKKARLSKFITTLSK
jgi:small subunit ribosomal protein S20